MLVSAPRMNAMLMKSSVPVTDFAASASGSAKIALKDRTCSPYACWLKLSLTGFTRAII